MIGLILRRLRIQKAERWWNQRKAMLTPAIFAYLDGQPFDTALGRSVLPTDIRPLQDIALDLIGSVRGDSREKLILLLINIGAVADNAERLRSGKEWERLQAVRNLSLYPKEKVENLLRGALSDQSFRLRCAAAKALIDMGAEIGIEALVDRLFSHGGTKSVALREIFRRVAPHQTDALRRILREQPVEPVRLLVIDALGAIRDYPSIPILMEQCDSASIDVRAEAIRALTTIGHPDGAAAILSGLADDAWEVRAQAAAGAGRIGVEEAISTLSDLLDDDEWWVRFRAAEALKNIGGKGAEILADAATDTSRSANVAELVLSQSTA